MIEITIDKKCVINQHIGGDQRGHMLGSERKVCLDDFREIRLLQNGDRVVFVRCTTMRMFRRIHPLDPEIGPRRHSKLSAMRKRRMPQVMT